MGDIKDIFDLMTQFSKSIKDRETLSKFLELQSFVTQLTSDLFQCQKDYLDIKNKLDNCTQELKKQRSDDVCPFCKQPALRLMSIDDDEEFGEHLKWGSYECSNCAKKLRKES